MQQKSLQNQVLERLFLLYPEFRNKIIDEVSKSKIIEPVPFLEDAVHTALVDFIPMAIGFGLTIFEFEKDIAINQNSTLSYAIPDGKEYKATIKLSLVIEDITPPELENPPKGGL